MNPIDSAIQTDIKLPSPPAIAVRILEAVNKEDSSFDELGRIISADPALSTRILKVANSSFYSLPAKVDSIQRAMAILGCNVLKNIALSFVIVREMRLESKENFDFDLFWKRSVTAGVSAGLIASLDTAEKLASELQTANDKLRGMAFEDSLTGLFNHRYFQACMDIEFSKAVRYQRPFSLIMLDLDHFKKVNDRYGHPSGDAVLKQVSATIRQTVRKSDIVSRYGGEEFTVVLPETTLKGAVLLAERIRKRVEGLEVGADEETIRMTISLGLTIWEPGSPAGGKADIIDAADRALYASKRNGRNKVSFVPVAAPE